MGPWFRRGGLRRVVAILEEEGLRRRCHGLGGEGGLWCMVASLEEEGLRWRCHGLGGGGRALVCGGESRRGRAPVMVRERFQHVVGREGSYMQWRVSKRKGFGGGAREAPVHGGEGSDAWWRERKMGGEGSDAWWRGGEGGLWRAMEGRKMGGKSWEELPMKKKGMDFCTRSESSSD